MRQNEKRRQEEKEEKIAVTPHTNCLVKSSLKTIGVGVVIIIPYAE